MAAASWVVTFSFRSTLPASPGCSTLPTRSSRWTVNEWRESSTTRAHGVAPQRGCGSGRAYQLGLGSYAADAPMIYGDLGAFWMTEMSWQEQSQALQVGPVPATDPSLPVGLNLRFNGTVLNEVVATAPSGATYLFAAAPHIP